MNRRFFLLSMTVAPIVAVIAACGDPTQQSTSTEPTTPGTTPTTIPAGLSHPTGADDVVVRLAYEGGFVAPDYLFASIPQLLVSGDGRAFTQGLFPEVYPGPLLPNILVRTINEDGIQLLLGVANAAGLLAPPADYTGGTQIADAPDTVLTINGNGGTFIHSAYALGIDNPETPARARLLDAVTSLSDVELTVGAAKLGTNETFVATTYRLRATATDPSALVGQEPAPIVIDWPAATGVSLADAGDCARVDAEAVGSLFIDATQNTYFRDGDIVYHLAVRGVLPGDPAC